MSRFLVCAPDYFRIDYEINPWMRRANAVVADNAARQWRELMEVLEGRVGAALERMAPVPGLPDLVFTANAAVVAGRRAALGPTSAGPRLPSASPAARSGGACTAKKNASRPTDQAQRRRCRSVTSSESAPTACASSPASGLLAAAGEWRGEV